MGIGGSKKSFGSRNVQIPFLLIGIFIDVYFLIMTGDVPSLLSLKDMFENGLEFSIQKCTVSFNGRSEPLIMKNYFPTYNWNPSDVPYTFHTESELRRIHRTFGHPNVKETSGLLRSAAGGTIEEETRH